MQAYVTTPGLALLIVPLIAAAAGAAAARLFAVAETKGWRRIKPGPGYWLALILALGLSGLIGFVWAVVGSARSDGAMQMAIAWWLAFIFGLGAAWTGWRMAQIARAGLRWRGRTLVHGAAASPVTEAMDAVSLIKSRWWGSTEVRFTSGRTVYVDQTAAGAVELITRLCELNGLTDTENPVEH